MEAANSQGIHLSSNSSIGRLVINKRNARASFGSAAALGAIGAVCLLLLGGAIARGKFQSLSQTGRALLGSAALLTISGAFVGSILLVGKGVAHRSNTKEAAQEIHKTISF